MKKTLMLLMAMGALDTTVASNAGQNLIVNGNFADSPCTAEVCIYNTENTVKGWIPEPDIQVGLGFHYSQFLRNERVLDLAPSSNSCVKQIVKNLKTGVYQLSFQYASRSDRLSSDCQFQILFNDKLLKRITPQGDRIQTETIEIKVDSTSDGSVKFCSVGQDNNIFGAVLKSVRLIQKNVPGLIPFPPNTPAPIFKPGQDLIANGKFTQNVCERNVCIFHFPGFNRIRNWMPEPDIEIGWGSLYNRFLGRQRVLDLAPNSNSCVRQVVRYMQPGTYQLLYEYAARSNTPPSDCEFQVKFDGETLKKVSPTDDTIQTDTVEFEFKSGTEGELRFCSVGNDNHLGSALHSVRMIRKVNNLVKNFETIHLDSHSSKCLQRQYEFQGGQVKISFSYKVISNSIVQDSAVFLVLDGNPIYKVKTCNDGRDIRIQGQVTKGPHSIGFCTRGSPFQAPHQVAISNFILNQSGLTQ